MLILSVIKLIQSQSERACNFQTNTIVADEGDYCWALIGNDGQHLQEERKAHIEAKVFSLSWRESFPDEGITNKVYLERKHTELTQLRQAGFDIILSLGVHDVPAWVHTNYSDTYYVNQFGIRYTDNFDAGDANLVFNPALRTLAETYIQFVFINFGTEFAAVRIGGGRYGELTYPPAEYQGYTNCYWAFDANAQTHNPVPHWIPGQPSPHGEAQAFLTWYLTALVDFQQWQINVVRQFYGDPIMILYPSWGIRPGDIERAVADNLSGVTAAERNGEIQRGFDFARQVQAITDPGIILTTTWLDADASADDSNDARYWSPVKYLHSLAAKHPLHLALYGENTGRGQRTQMELSIRQMRQYGLLGMAWFREDELFSGQYATLQDYASFTTSIRTVNVWEYFRSFLQR